jgi:hypothetical protein
MACPEVNNLDFVVKGRDISQFDPPVIEAKDLQITLWDLEHETPTRTCVGYARLRTPIFETRENEKYGYGIGTSVVLGSVGETRTLTLRQRDGIRMVTAGKKSRRSKKYRGKTLKKRRSSKKLI